MSITPNVTKFFLITLYLYSTAGQRKEAPPRPPPPTQQPNAPAFAPGSSATLPYPTHGPPPNMPIPFGAQSNAPYPSYYMPPMPASYNPYATIAGYPHHSQSKRYILIEII